MTPAQQILETPGFRQACWLTMNGVPFDVAFSLDATELAAFTIAMGEFGTMRESSKFDWEAQRWIARG